MEHIHKKDKSLQMCFLLTYLALQLHCITLTTTPHFISLFFSKLALGEQIILCMAPAQPVGVAQSHTENVARHAAIDFTLTLQFN